MKSKLVLGLLLASISGSSFAASTVNVLLQEFKIRTDVSSAPAGEITFVVQNRGKELHELVVMKTDMPFDRLPQKGNEGIDEAAAGSVVDELEDLKPRSKSRLTVKLTPGNYVLLCNITEMEEGELEKHYSMGMRAPFTVR